MLSFCLAVLKILMEQFTILCSSGVRSWFHYYISWIWCGKRRPTWWLWCEDWYPCWALLSLVILRSCRILYISLILFRFAWKMFVGHTCWLCLHDSHVKYPRRGKATCNIGGRVSGFLVIVCLCLFSSMVKYSILSLISAIICDQYHHLPQL